jgi:hypothetical protein
MEQDGSHADQVIGSMTGISAEECAARSGLLLAR